MTALGGATPTVEPHRTGGLRGQLVRSHLSVAGLGIAALLAVLVAIVPVRSEATRIAESRSPAALAATSRIRLAVETSQAALRGWTLLGDPRFKEQRRRAWSEDIRPALAELQRLGRADDQAGLAGLADELSELDSAQWWVEDVARTPGNEPSALLFSQAVTPSSERIFSLIAALVELEDDRPSPTRAVDQLVPLAGLLEAFRHAHAAANDVCQEGRLSRVRVFRSQWRLVQAHFARLEAGARSGSAAARERVRALRREIGAYASQADAAIARRQTVDWNVALHLMATDTVPAADRATRSLRAVASKEKTRMRSAAVRLADRSRTAVGVAIALVIGMVVIAWMLSARRSERLLQPITSLVDAATALAAGERGEEIQAVGDDELAELSRAFNSMQAALANRETALKASERHAVELATQAESANLAKSEFLANMSHEIRTPMNAILGFASLLSDRATDRREARYLESIRTSGDTLLRLIDDILDLSKVEAGMLSLEYGPTDLRQLCNQVFRVFAENAARKKVELRVEVRPDVPTHLLLDETRVRQILVNLVGNAVKFTDEGYVALSARSHRGAEDASRLTLVLTVTDTGVGIPPEEQTRIFGAFEQRRGQSHAHYGGTGLGLAITRRLVEAMKGEITVESTPKRGSAFRVRLPEVQVAATKTPAEARSTEDARFVFEPAVVLVADDVSLNRQLLRDYLEEEGLDVIEASDGAETIAAALRQRPALVLMDIRMPGLDGREAAAAIKSDPELGDIPIVAVTAMAMADPQSTLAERFDAVLTKPVGRSDLLKMAARFLAHRTVTKTEAAESPAARPEAALPVGSLSPAEAERLRGLLVQLTGELREAWKAVRRSAFPDEVEAFGRRVCEAAAAGEYEPAKVWGERLCEHAAMFDLDGLAATLSEYYSLVRRLEARVEGAAE